MICTYYIVGAKYGQNRFNRKTARIDTPIAKIVQSEEEERLQREKLSHLERQKIMSVFPSQELHMLGLENFGWFFTELDISELITMQKSHNEYNRTKVGRSTMRCAS